MTHLGEASVWLFCPANRPERYERALAAAEVVIIDLEDAVALEDKDSAREALLAAAPGLDPARVVVRVNATDQPAGKRDIEALERTHLRTVMLPKATAAEQVAALRGFEVIPLCESASGIQAAAEMAAVDNCVALTWGGQDLAVDLGAVAIRDEQGGFLPIAQHARMQIRYGAAVAGIPAIDTVWIAIDDLDGIAREARDAAEQGFAGKMVIHPRHVEPVAAAFRPSEAQIADAERIVAAAATAGEGATSLDGRMLDRPVIEQARMILARARR